MLKPRVIVGLSGGVDSSVSALLLQQQGYDVQGIFMKNWEEDDTAEYCSASVDIADAQAVCDSLKIPLHTVNFAAEYWERVFENFLQEYKAGRTPNPDILCNKEIKFNAFLTYALQLGADFIATGHYAGIARDTDELYLTKCADNNKDQTYFLYTLGQAQLSRTIFPLTKFTKPQVRLLAEKAGLSNFKKKDSTGICFIGERKFKDFLNRYLPAQPGNMETPAGQIIGQHDGLMYYTIGQRQGLRIGGKKTATEEPWYVLGKDIVRNVLIVGQGHNHPLLFSTVLYCSQINWVSGTLPVTPFFCSAKVRYRQVEQPCKITSINTEQYLVEFEKPQRAITPGQSVVFYQQNICLGGGIIEKAEKTA